MVKIHFFGAAGRVTGSNFLIEGSKARYIVDCGLFQGEETIPKDNEQPFPYDSAQIKAVIVTHAHLDHIGRLPKLVKEGFRGPIYATAATADLTVLVLKDALHLMERHHDQEGRAMLYEQADLDRTVAQFHPVPYHTKTELLCGDSFTLYDAGHILGSASVLLEVDDKKLVFSGDIGHWPSVLLPQPESPPGADVVITEATYGGEEREDPEDRLTVLKKALAWTIERKGVLLIPAFSIERSQELLFLLHELFVHHQLPRVPIFLDSPLAIEALEVFERHKELFAKKIQTEHGRRDDIFDFGSLALTPTVEESKDINDVPPPKVIIAGSGMMVGGRIAHHLKHYLSRPNTCLLIIGFQAPGTLGERIANGRGAVEIAGAYITIRANVVRTGAFSGHADNSELLRWLQGTEIADDGKVVIVHSEPGRAKKFQKELIGILPGRTIETATYASSLEI
ncbi:hypothetical protein A3A71_04170 [Candidatus Berkelbacteria bacterium RIFCSPLOWO2_01_FULL_50_28]|uniref:MBL fold hydrolase n=1 Tax=Candidatus Berkelbacteria bacterium RIFCSPLOWO2_01_FULL_50_28 TaxID=1797471 RepID=A0A1F5EAB4_9BACT|nr:MAG: hypothetical protein A2807_03440 [Candidatus Berkelbacteria bacterium RIFCSPHIGHO2_01_FULL_50_36]OGD62453.1 MAG: hypothetical protein A3F39_01980 [Candidatus Berkelbacteria bacterium RIFCSPHIGHO2_12_FULL_50_11]OGD64328.1 MAG: hypothetical protein A3A71_04170 [Candidatus Berkelbacteria bacterium RIFCSPLOWO2_01_FULL_50_28]